MSKLQTFFLCAFTLTFYTASLLGTGADGEIAIRGGGGRAGGARVGGGVNVGRVGVNRGVGAYQRSPTLTRAYVAGRAVGTAATATYAAPYYYYPTEPYYYQTTTPTYTYPYPYNQNPGY
jgi:hypothetical protein